MTYCTKKEHPLTFRNGNMVWRLLVAVILLFTAVALPAIELDVGPPISIAPRSIPIGSTGATGIGMARLQFRPTDSTAPTNMTISQIEIQATTSGTFDANWVSSIEVYYEPKGAAVGDEGEYDHGSGLNDVRADLAAKRPYTFTGNDATIDIDPAVVSFVRPGGASNYLFVVFNITNNVDTAETLGCEITSVTYSHPTSSLSPASLATHSGTGNLDDYTVTAAATGEAPTNAATDATNVPLLLLNLSLADTSTTAHLKSVKVRRTTGADNYVAASGVLLYADDGDGFLNPGVGPGLDGDPIATATMGAGTSGYATLTLGTSADVPAAGSSFFVAVNLDSANALIGDSFGLEVENPASDITFEDTIVDDTTNDADQDYAYVTYSAAGLYQYDQEAYVDPATTTAIPVSGNEFAVVPADDSQDPTVIARSPAPGEENADPTDSINIVFSEGMDVDSAENLNSYRLYNVTVGATESFAATYTPATQTVVLDPTTDLIFGNEYQVTVYGLPNAPNGVQDFYGNYMAANDVFTFTIRNEYPDFTQPAVTKNRIGTGTNSEALIFVPQPPGGASARVSVQVFTTTGKLVRTFYKNVPWSTIGASPISWNGTNDRGQDLGPGMYFVQVRTESYKRVLKVMIVR